MNDLLERINKLAAAKQVPDAAAVAALKADIEKLPPDVAALLNSLLNNLVGGSAAGTKRFDWKALLPVSLALLGGATVGGGTVGAAGNWGAVGQSFGSIAGWISDIQFGSYWTMIACVLAFGAVVGLIYSVIHNRGLILPSFNFDRTNRSVTFDQWGCVDELVFAALAAVMVCWQIPADPSGKFHMTGWLIMSTATAAVVGARLRAGMQDRGMLWDLLGGVLASPQASAFAKLQVLNAPTARAAAQIAEAVATDKTPPPQ